MFKILVVEDDRDLNRTVCTYLSRNGYEAIGCLNANDAYNEMYGNFFDLIISDIMMPDIDGFAFAETVRSLNQEIPILFMTARDDFSAKQRGFRLGIDDYLVKPVNLEELLLRIGALLRRARINSQKRLTVGKLTMDADERTAVLDGEEIPLTVREFNLLYKLLSYPKKTFTRSALKLPCRVKPAREAPSPCGSTKEAVSWRIISTIPTQQRRIPKWNRSGKNTFRRIRTAANLNSCISLTGAVKSPEPSLRWQSVSQECLHLAEAWHF